MKVTITGGAGFIGANLASHLVGKGADVTVLDDLSTGYQENLEGLGIEFIHASILDAAASKVLASAEAVVHLAAVPSVPRSIKEPVASHEVNATGTLRVLESVRERGSHVVVASSSSVYGANEILPKSESMRVMPVSPYAVSKLAAESYAISYQRCYGLPTLAFRFFNVFGPLQAPGHAYAAVIPAFTFAALAGEELKIHGDGSQTRDFTFVGTVVDTITAALEQRVASIEPVNLAFGTRYSLMDVVSHIENEIGQRVRVSHTEPRAGDVRDSQADPARVKELFPAIAPVSLSDGLKSTISWMRSRTGQPTNAPPSRTTASN